MRQTGQSAVVSAPIFYVPIRRTLVIMPVAVVSLQLAMLALMALVETPMLGAVLALKTLMHPRMVAVIASVIPVVIVAVVPAVMLSILPVMLAAVFAVQFRMRVPVAAVQVTMHLAVAILTAIIILMCRRRQGSHAQQ